MDVPGLSLFQGAESIKLDNDQKRVEEEEENAALLRRNEEVSETICVEWVSEWMFNM